MQGFALAPRCNPFHAISPKGKKGEAGRCDLVHHYVKRKLHHRSGARIELPRRHRPSTWSAGGTPCSFNTNPDLDPLHSRYQTW